MMKNKIADLLASFEFWYAKKFIKLDKHYTFFFDLNGESDTFAVKYLKKYKGVIVEFANVKVGEGGLLTFDYDIISNVNNCNVKSKSFDRFTSNVMRSILHGAIETGVRTENENRKSDLVESDSERSIYEEVVTVSEERVPNRKPRKKTVRRNKAVHSEVQQSATDSSTGNQS
jgi:hypothetical protein